MAAGAWLGGGVSVSASLPSTAPLSGTLERLVPCLELALLRTLLATLCSVSLSVSQAGPVFTSCGAWPGYCDPGRVFRDRLEDWEGERLDWTRLDLLPAICSTLEKISLLQSDPMLRRLASTESRVLEPAGARADSKLPFQLNRSSSKPETAEPELAEPAASSSWPRGSDPRRCSVSRCIPCHTSYSVDVDLAMLSFKLLSSNEALLLPRSRTSTDFEVFLVNLNGFVLGEVPKFGPINTFGESNELNV